ncbi:MAG: Hsp33 family molecular chaperone HslO [Hydrogenophilales bacterium CG_4_9_14_3_um_filter_59_35]|nr:MAG: Hsp33 family molecular chaperone HslO [Hydrogenophilales bacterium CG18_big_fil_WC_8_21_14_2_50_58_12]PIY01971.1 MAG: Hsp33 family molecular chaperone HslO [Hydrogenophilales bacterium CG_4_10_14_3_um_filter_58_23]PJB08327.1 MAG: Hsp33 family molecular chaperone HslO [Hydrogenophilales bacterium CG_4_9_14_3_um_filter_59_35]
MKQSDSLQRFMFEHAAVRGEIVHLEATWKAVLERRDYPPALRTVLGELMAAAALLSATLKFSGSLIMQIQGGGPVRLLVVECGADLTMRAMAHWEGDLAEGAALPELVGEGRFVITLDPKKGGQTYQGIVDLEGGSVATVLENYMQRSEQLDTRIWLAAGSHGAAGMLLQKMPDGPEADKEAWNRAVHLGATVKPRELLDLSAREIIHRLFHEEDIRLFDSTPVHFGCTCSRERVANTLRMLGYDEVHSLLDEIGYIEADCEFCNQHYVFDVVDAVQVFASDGTGPASYTRH